MKNYAEVTNSLANNEITSEQFQARQKLREDMKASDIAGMSALIIKKGEISFTWFEGTVNSTRCGLLKLLELPTPEEQKRLNKSYYILTAAGLHYFNKSKEKLENIPLDSLSLKKFQDTFASEQSIDILSDQQLKIIESITKHEHFSPSKAVDEQTVFGAASLSKPVFAYLVLKLIQANIENTAKPGLGKFNAEFNLKTPIYEIYPDILNKFRKEDEDKAKKLTAEMVLSHTTGLPIFYNAYKFASMDDSTREPGKIYINSTLLGLEYEVIGLDGKLKKDSISWDKLPDFPRDSSQILLSKDKERFVTTLLEQTSTLGHTKGPIEFQFEPGTKYSYSGPGIAYLQEAIEALTDSNLEALAQEHLFGEKALDMKNTSFTADKTKPAQAANSLYTTPTDFAKFILAWLNDEKIKELFDPFKPMVFMSNAYLPENWPVKGHIDTSDKEHVAWCLGMGVQTNDNGEPIRLYHSGDMDEWRAWFAINLEDKSAVIYFSNSHNGHILADSVITPNFRMDAVFNFFFQTFGFARNLQELEGKTNFHGINPAIFRPEEKKAEMKSTENIEPEQSTTEQISKMQPKA